MNLTLLSPDISKIIGKIWLFGGAKDIGKGKILISRPKVCFSGNLVQYSFY